MRGNDNKSVCVGGDRNKTALVMLALAAATIAAYVGVLQNDFINFDDPLFVTANTHVKEGLSLDGVKWAMTELRTDYWHPLAWVSHMLDMSLFGMWAGGHHLVSVVLHVLNTLLLLGFLRYATGHLWTSAFVAGLFALHPLHVESVAWVAERKDVLCTLFWLATMWMYVSYAKNGGWRRYAYTVLLYAMALMSKPMAVTLPLLLLLLDYWPLERFEPRWPTVRRLVMEKVPFAAMAGAIMVVTVIGQRAAAAMIAMEDAGLVSRLKNAVVSYCRYIGTMVWPDGLAVLYPSCQTQLWVAIAALLFLAAVTAAAIAARRRRYILVGWLWYLAVLIPVIGVVQVGPQSHADRYTYVSLVGLFIIVAWGGAEVVSKKPQLRRLAAVLAAAILVISGVATYRQAAYWKDTSLLAGRAVALTRDNYIMLRVLGQSQMSYDQDKAMANLQESLKVGPGGEAPMTLAVIGRLLYEQGKYGDALEYANRALAIRGDAKYALLVKGLACGGAGQFEEAEKCLTKAIELDGQWPQAYAALAMVEGERGRLDEGIALYRKAVGMDPYLDDAWFNLAVLYQNKRDFRQAAVAYGRSVVLRPTYETWIGLAGCLVATENLRQAEMAYRQAIKLDAAQGDAYYGLAVVLNGMGRGAEAVEEAKKAVTLAPENAAAKELYQMLTKGRQ